MRPAEQPTMRYAFTIIAHVGTYLPLENRSGDLLEFIPITGGSVSGEVSGAVIPGGGDWCLTRNDDAYQVEARYLIRTDLGDVVDVVNVGILRHLEGQSGGSKGMGYFLTTPRFRTTAIGLQWLTRSVFVGQAITSPDNTTIHVYEVMS